MDSFACPDPEATRALAWRLAGALRGGEVIVLEGDLGAGKTFFVQALTAALDLDPDIAVTSPTFALVHEYPEARLPLLHADLYRLGDPDELIELGIEDRLEEGGWVTVVEWGEPFIEALGGADLILRLRTTAPEAREVSAESLSVRGAALVDALGGGE